MTAAAIRYLHRTAPTQFTYENYYTKYKESNLNGRKAKARGKEVLGENEEEGFTIPVKWGDRKGTYGVKVREMGREQVLEFLSPKRDLAPTTTKIKPT